MIKLDHYPIKKILSLTYLEGFFFTIMVACSESYALLYFTKQGLSPLKIGMLATFPPMLAAIVQFILPGLISSKSLRPALLGALLIQSFGLFGLWRMSMGEYEYSLLMLALSLYWIGGQLAAPLWVDWISELCPKNVFAHFISRRNTIIIIITMIIFISVSFWIDLGAAFSTLFLLGFLARVMSLIIQGYIIFNVKKHSLKTTDSHLHESLLSRRSSERVIEQKILYRFFLWGGLFRFAVNISAPYFLPHMINELKFTTSAYVFLSAIPMLGNAFSQHNWMTANKKGRPYFGIQLAALIISTFPALWVVSSDYMFLIFLQILSGIFWGGMELTQLLMVQNFSYGNSRTMMGQQLAINTTFSVLGALLGGLLFRMSLTTHDVFMVSTMFRFVVAIFLIYTMRQFQLSRLSFHQGTVYLSTVLSVRPSLANIARGVGILVKRNRHSS